MATLGIDSYITAVKFKAYENFWGINSPNKKLKSRPNQQFLIAVLLLFENEINLNKKETHRVHYP